MAQAVAPPLPWTAGTADLLSNLMLRVLLLVLYSEKTSLLWTQ